MSSKDFDLESSTKQITVKSEIIDINSIKEEVVEDITCVEYKPLKNIETVWRQLNEQISVKNEPPDDSDALQADIKQELLDASLLPQTNDTSCNIKQEKGVKLHHCEVCKRYFAFSSSLEAHKVDHIGEKSFKCTSCDKIFDSSDLLKRHELRHTGKKRRGCEICYRGFTRLDYMKQHRLFHMYMSKPYRCQICDESFASLTKFKIHKKKHSNLGHIFE